VRIEKVDRRHGGDEVHELSSLASPRAYRPGRVRIAVGDVMWCDTLGGVTMSYY
jgi:hypothetical protein